MIKTLEHLTWEMKQQGIKDEQVEPTLHTASLMALIQATYAVVNEECLPTPLYRLIYDETAHNLQFQPLDGRAPVPRDDALDISMLDLLIASDLREKMPLLWEGKTGIGKTFTTEKFARTLFAEENYRVLRLNQIMSNVQQPYTEGRIENGVVKIFLRKDELEKIGLLFIDEVNRGDSNQVLQLQDGRIVLPTGERGELGIPIPTYKDGQWDLDREHKKPVHVISAQNPPATKDARYTNTRGTDAAQKNRDLLINIPNAMPSIGASAVLVSEGNGQHKRFLAHYVQSLSHYLGVEPNALKEMIGPDWLSMYAFTTDPRKTEHPSIRSGIEFLDGLLLLVSPDLPKEYEREKEVSKQWTEKMQSLGLDFEYKSTLDANAVVMQKVRDIVISFEEEVITRDITKVKKLADAISTIRRYKEAFKSESPVTAYQQIPDFITVEDLACAFAVMLKDKQQKKDIDPTTLVDAVLKEYVSLVEGFAHNIGFRKTFNSNDVNMSIYNLTVQHALLASLAESKDANGKVINQPARFVKDIATSVAILKRLEAAGAAGVGTELRKPLLSRYVADLSTLAGFAMQYGDTLGQRWAEYSVPAYVGSKVPACLRSLKDFYKEKKLSVSTPEIYLQKLPRVLGV